MNCKHLSTSCDGKCLRFRCGFSVKSKRESDTMKGRLDEELGELKFTDKELCDRIENFVEAELERERERTDYVIKYTEDLQKMFNIVVEQRGKVRKETLTQVKEIIEGRIAMWKKGTGIFPEKIDELRWLLKQLNEL